MRSSPPRPKADVLYVTYDGLLEPLGHSQIVSYLVRLASHGIRIVVLSFEKPEDLRDSGRIAGLEIELRQAGIFWIRTTYHRRPRVVSTILDVHRGFRQVLRTAQSYEIHIIHARSYVPALMALPTRWLEPVRFLFDMRGFWPEERVELGIFRRGGILYRLSKYLEKRFLGGADQVVVLTHQAKRVLLDRSVASERIEVIPCCVDLERFSSRISDDKFRERTGLADKLVVGNIGAVNKRYMLREGFRFFHHLKRIRPNAHFLYITRQDPKDLWSLAEAEDIGPRDLTVLGAVPDEIPQWLSIFELGIFFLQPSYAAQASSFTKLGEFLAAGIPVVTNTGVGDVEDILTEQTTGFLVKDFSDDCMEEAARRAAAMLPLQQSTKDACRCAAEDLFSLEDGCMRYLSIYRALLSTHPAAVTHEQPRVVL